MGAMKFYKRNPGDALVGMRGLTPAEKGAYNTVLDLIYNFDNRLLDDDRFIAGWVECNIGVWRRIKITLLEKEKLYIEDGFIKNFRATSVIDEALNSSKIVSEINREKGIKSGASRRKNKGLHEPNVEPKTNHLIDRVIDREREEENNPSLLPSLPEPETIAVEGWNEMVDWQIAKEKPGTSPPRIPKVQNLTERRKSAFKLRWHEVGGHHGWTKLLEIIKQSPHLLGQNDRGWTVTFDWVLNPTNLAKIMEGNYVRKQSGNTKQGGTTEALEWLHREAERREGTPPGDDSGGGEPEP